MIYDLDRNCDSSSFWPSQSKDNAADYLNWNIWIKKPVYTIIPSLPTKLYHVDLEVTIWAFLDFYYNADKTRFTRNTKIFTSTESWRRHHSQRPKFQVWGKRDRAHLGYIRVTYLEDTLGKLEYGRERHICEWSIWGVMFPRYVSKTEKVTEKNASVITCRATIL